MGKREGSWERKKRYNLNMLHEKNSVFNKRKKWWAHICHSVLKQCHPLIIITYFVLLMIILVSDPYNMLQL